MDLSNAIDPLACGVGLKARTKDEALWKLAELARRSKALEGVDAQTIYSALNEREQQGSTGFGKEVALPHARIPGMDTFLVGIAVFGSGVPFDAVDKKKAKVFFVILGPAEDVQNHLRLLAAISRIIAHTNAKQELLKSRSVEAAVEAFQRHIVQSEGPAVGTTSGPGAMKMVLITVYEEQYMYDILELLLEFGVDGATIMESTGMSRYISNVPLFAEFIGFMNESKNASKTILALAPERHIRAIVERIEEVTGDLDKREGAMILVLDVSFYKGTMKML
ncbi:MAG: PTS sugar transporter subunit IIA [Spirochaetota bacterium]